MQPVRLTIGSLFSGIGGLELGLEMALGADVLWQVEREPSAREVLARHWPDADRTVQDVRQDLGGLFPQHYTIDRLKPVDLVCGGFPCQDISPAGKGEGIHGTRSGLWGAGFVPVLRLLRPRLVVVENSNLLPRRGLNVVLGDLAQLGYNAEWARIGACDVGAPHRRWRCFIVAWLANACPNGWTREGVEQAAEGRADRGGANVSNADMCRSGESAPNPVRTGGAKPIGGSECTTYAKGERREPWAIARPTCAGGACLGEALNPSRQPGETVLYPSPVFVEWLMGFPPGWVTDPSK